MAIVFEQNFEAEAVDETPNTWVDPWAYSDTGSNDIKVISSPVYAGSRAARMYSGDSSNAYASIQEAALLTDNTQVDCYARAAQLDKALAILYTTDSHTGLSTKTGIAVAFWVDGKIYYNDGGSWTDSGIAYNTSTWYHVRYIVHNTARTWDLYITDMGTPIATGIDYRNDLSCDYFTLLTGNAQLGTVYIDNITLTVGEVKELAGVSAIESTTAGVLKADRELAGVSVIASTTTGSIKLTQELIGTVAIASTTTGELVSPERELAGSVAIETTTAGDLTRTGTQELAGVVAIVSTTSGTLEELIGGFSDDAENKILELITGKTPFSKPTVYVGFCTADPGEEATGADCNEVPDTNGYGRIAVAADDWNSASAGAIDNANAIASPKASGSWGEITHYVLVDSPNHGEGNVLVYDELDTTRVVDEDDSLVFAAGELNLMLN